MKEKLARLQLVATDVDGTLTDAKLYFFPEEKEPLKTFNVRDGLGFLLAKKAGLKIAVISGLQSRAASNRFKKFLNEDVYLGIEDKSQIMRLLRDKYNLSKEQVAFIGDDLQDLPAFRESGVKVAVADAHPFVKKEADIVLQKGGGDGAFREFIEMVLEAKGLLEKIFKEFLP